MSNPKTVKVENFASSLGFSISVPGRGEFEIDKSDINLPGLQFAGHFLHFANDRVQLAGNAEMTMVKEVSEKTLTKRMKEFFSQYIPAIVIARGYEAPDIMKKAAVKAGVPIFLSNRTTTKCSHAIADYLDRVLAITISRHGGLIDVYGVGIMLTGESGIGKSETALELIKRGHRLVADDVVEIKKVNENRIVGSSPELVRYLMEIRGIGIIDIRHMYGVGAVMLEKSIDIIMELEDWVEGKAYDRLGLDDFYTELLDVKINSLLMPVRPGRNLAVIVEVAARNFRSKLMGYNAAVEFDKKLKTSLSVDLT